MQKLSDWEGIKMTIKLTFETIQSLKNYLVSKYDAQAYGFATAFEDAVIRHQNTDLEKFEFDWVTMIGDVITLAVKINDNFDYEVEVK